MTGLLSGRTEPYHGYTGLEQYMADLASTWKRIELQPQQFNRLDEERVLVFGRVRAWHERGFLDSSNAWLWTIRGGKVASVQVFADPSEARRAFTDEAERPAQSLERLDRGPAPRVLEPRPLVLCPVAERDEVDAVQALAERVTQCLPQRQLSGHPDQQALELEHPAER